MLFFSHLLFFLAKRISQFYYIEIIDDISYCAHSTTTFQCYSQQIIYSINMHQAEIFLNNTNWNLVDQEPTSYKLELPHLRVKIRILIYTIEFQYKSHLHFGSFVLLVSK